MIYRVPLRGLGERAVTPYPWEIDRAPPPDPWTWWKKASTVLAVIGGTAGLIASVQAIRSRRRRRRR